MARVIEWMMTSLSADPRPLRVGLVGFGLGGAVFHAPLIAAARGMELAAIVTRNTERRAEASRRVPGARIVSSVEELWAPELALDLVAVSAPSGMHASLAHDALAHHCHVVVDKPFAGSSSEARQIAAHAAAVGRLAIPFQNRRWDGDFLTLRELVADGTLGRIHRLESRFERWRAEPRPRWREAGARGMAEGIVYDIGSHLVDQALVLLGPVRTVYAELARRHPLSEVEDDAFISLRHEGGARSHLYLSAMSPVSGPRFVLTGSAGAYRKDGLDGQEAALREGADASSAGWSSEDAAAWGTVTRGTDTQVLPTLPGEYASFYPAVASAIRHGTAAPVLVGEAVAALEVIEAVFTSAARGTVVRLF